MKNIMKTILPYITLICGGVLGAEVMWRIREKKISSVRQLSDKYLRMMHVLNQWLNAQQTGADISKYFMENNYHTIAVYGMGCLGERLTAALRGTDIRVSYCIDKRAEDMSDIGMIKSMEDDLPEVDAIVVTAIYYFDEIEDELSEKVNCPIISLEDIIKRI